MMYLFTAQQTKPLLRVPIFTDCWPPSICIVPSNTQSGSALSGLWTRNLNSASAEAPSGTAAAVVTTRRMISSAEGAPDADGASSPSVPAATKAAAPYLNIAVLMRLHPRANSMPHFTPHFRHTLKIPRGGDQRAGGVGRPGNRREGHTSSNKREDPARERQALCRVTNLR